MFVHNSIRKMDSKKRNTFFTKAERIETKTFVINKFVRRRLILFGIIAGSIGGSLIYSLVTQANILKEKTEQRERLQAQLIQLEKNEKELNQEIENLNDPEYLGKLARRDYFLSKKGEIIFQLGHN